MIFINFTLMCDCEDKQERRSILYGNLFSCQADKGSIIQNSLMTTRHQLKTSERKKAQLRKCPTGCRQVCN